MSTENKSRFFSICRVALWMGAWALVIGCSIDDDNRCAGDFVWTAEYSACVCPQGSEWSGRGNECLELHVDTGEDDAGMSDAGSDSGTAIDEDKEFGLGEACEYHSDCADYRANACAPSITSNPYCTIDCESGADCKDGFSCCDCTASTVITPPQKACVIQGDVSIASSVGGCTCD